MAGRMTGSKADWKKGEQEGLPQNPPPIRREGVGDKYSFSKKGVGGGGGRLKGRVNPRASTKFKITDQSKSKIIEGVAVYGWDTPHPPLPSTTNRIG